MQPTDPLKLMHQRCNVLALTTGTEQYVVLYDDDPASRCAALVQLGQWASNPALPFEWRHAELLAKRVERLADERCGGG